MSTRSLIGVLDADGLHFRVRYCHSDGYPNWQVPQLSAALFLHHGDGDQLTARLLEQDWSVINPVVARAEAADQNEFDNETSPGVRRPSHIQPLVDLGFYYTDVDPGKPIPGDLGESPKTDFEWLYLFTNDGTLRVFANRLSGGGTSWQRHGDWDLFDLVINGAHEIHRQKQHLRA
ncbi:hypothetical protein [Parasphingorhabdus pacifica]